MATATLIFLVIGAAGTSLLALALLGGELLPFGEPGSGPFTLEVIAGFAGAFGFGAAIANELIGTGTLGATAIGVVAAVPIAWFTARLSRAARDMPTDPTPTREHLVGAIGRVVTPIPANGYGEVRVHVSGQPMKFNARADRPLPAGAQVFVVESLSETSVHVESY